ncbi:BTB/POZ and MATH domain-containing protein 2-like [Carex rostrata]
MLFGKKKYYRHVPEVLISPMSVACQFIYHLFNLNSTNFPSFKIVFNPMKNSASVNYIKASHHFKFNHSQMKDLPPEQFVSSPVFNAIGHEWVIDCYPQGSRREWSGIHTSFLVRLHSEYKIVNPIFSLSFMARNGTTTALSRLLLERDKTSFKFAVEKSCFRGQVFAYADYNILLLRDNFVNDGSFELICSINNTDIPHNRCSLGVPKSLDLHSQIGQLLESSETADVTYRVENRSFTCHRIVLAARSPVFKAELYGNMAEATQKLIKIEDMSPEVFEAMLHFIYTDSFPSCDSEKSSRKMAQHLFVAADRYAIDGLKALCEDKLCPHISLDTVTTTLALALQHNSPRLKNACLDFIAKPGNLVSWTLTNEYVDLVRSFPSIMDEIRSRVNTGSYTNTCSTM